MSTMYYEKDADMSVLDGKTVAIIGYGSQGHAHALNMHESGVNVVVGLYTGSPSWEKAEEAGLRVMTAADAAKAADVIMMLVNDEKQSKLYSEEHRSRPLGWQVPRVRPRFQHPLSGSRRAEGRERHHDRAKARAIRSRSQFQEGKGVPRSSRSTRIRAAIQGCGLAYAAGLEPEGRGIFETTFKEREETTSLVSRRYSAVVTRH